MGRVVLDRSRFGRFWADHGRLWLLAVPVALMVGAASAIFLTLLERVGQVFQAHPGLVYALPVLGGLVGLIYFGLGRRLEAGNNLLIDEIHDPQAVVPVRLAPMVLLGTLASHLAGASVGREGTAVQMGGALADQLSPLCGLRPDERRIVLMMGIAAGFASVFGAPMAGAVFGLEVLVRGRIETRALMPCCLAGLLAHLVALILGAHHAHYGAGPVPGIGLYSLFAVMVAAVAFGILARAFIEATHLLGKTFASTVGFAPLRPVLGGVVIVAVTQALAQLGLSLAPYQGLSLDLISSAFSTQLSVTDLVSKFGLTVLALGSGFKGGEVTPLFALGATMGNLLAPVLQMPIGTLAALGFVAVFSGAANTPLAGTLLAVELFGADLAPFALLACGISTLVSGRAGLYGAQRDHQALQDRSKSDPSAPPEKPTVLT